MNQSNWDITKVHLAHVIRPLVAFCLNDGLYLSGCVLFKCLFRGHNHIKSFESKEPPLNCDAINKLHYM